ncbi:MAG: hypothetical protein AAAC48_08190 [Phyllobacterium sp.]|uniref:hypothetical protein n=1 Tax=Phyllobacterium sp. TaxID=1871046 RepID=UPI0030F2110E
MDEEKKDKYREKIVREQMNLNDLRDAFRSQFKVIANDDRFTNLLDRLDLADRAV